MRLVGIVSFGLCLTIQAQAAEVASGTWTEGFVKIEEVASYTNFTSFRLSGVTSSCGQGEEGWWKLPSSTESSTMNKALDKALDYKKSLLLSAFMADKEIRLRCEDGVITDFSVRN